MFGLDGGDVANALMLGLIATVVGAVARRPRPYGLVWSVRYGALWTVGNLIAVGLRRTFGPTGNLILDSIAWIAVVVVVFVVFWRELEPMLQAPGPPRD